MSSIKREKKMEFKTFDFELKEVDSDSNENEGRIVGYASTFGNMDLGLDIVDKGAFKKTIRESKGKVPILADHSPYEQIGWNEKAEEDDTGLLVEGFLDLNVQKAKERFSLSKKALKIGAKMGLSIGYFTIKEEPDKENPRIRRLKELKLFEYSLVTFPMNVEAMVTAAKSVGAVDKARYLIEQLKKEGLDISDLEMALRKKAADVEYDPTKISQSINDLIDTFKS